MPHVPHCKPIGGRGHHTKIYLLIQCHLLQERQCALGQVGLACTIGSWATQGEVAIEGAAKGAPGVKQTLQTLHICQEVDDVL